MATSTLNNLYDSHDEDTDSLEIKPPQMISSRYDKHKKSSRSSRDKKHSREHRHKHRSHDRSDRHARHHSDSHSNRHHGIDTYDKYAPKDVEKGRKRYSEKTDGERELEDLRSRLLSKRSKQEIERKLEEHQMTQRNGDIELRQRAEKDTQHYKHHPRRSAVEEIDSPEDEYTDNDNDKYKTIEDPELIKRRAKLLDATREMTKRKEMAREELEARREQLHRDKEHRSPRSSESPQSHKRKHRRSHKKHHHSPDEVINVSDGTDSRDDDHNDNDEDNDDDNADSQRSESDRSDDSDDSSDSESDNKSNYSKSDDQSDADVRTSPLSVGELSKSGRRLSRSRSKSREHSRSTSSTSSNSSKRSSSSSDTSRRRRRSIGRDRERLPETVNEWPTVHGTETEKKRAHPLDRSSSKSRSSSRSKERDSSRDSQEDRDRRHSPYTKNSPHTKHDVRKAPHASETEDVEMKAPDSEPKEAQKDDVEPIDVEDELPSYYPGLQGCRSVEEFKCLNRIAEGTYGIVFRAKDKRTGEIVALKRLKMEKEKDGFPITSLREINTLLKGQHPNIVTVREIVVGSNMDKIFIVMDYVEHDFKTLMETMQQRKQSFLPGEVKCLTQQLLRAVAHLHDNWILHRDLKTSNLLLSHKGILKVGDFGLAREYGSPLKQYTSVVVTLWYRAPELLLCCKEYSTPIDMWSVGCIFAEFLAMSALFPGQSETDQLNRIFKFLGTPNEKLWPGYSQLPAVQKIRFAEYPVSNVREKFGRRTSDLGIQLLQGMLAYDPKQRFTADQALRSNYFKELPLPIDPAMLPTWPAKSELGARKALNSSPKPPSGGGQYKKLGTSDADENRGFVLGANMDPHARQLAMGPGFSLKF